MKMFAKIMAIEKDNNIIKCKSFIIKVPFIMYVDQECLLKNVNTCHNDPNKSATIKMN